MSFPGYVMSTSMFSSFVILSFFTCGLSPQLSVTTVKLVLKVPIVTTTGNGMPRSRRRPNFGVMTLYSLTLLTSRTIVPLRPPSSSMSKSVSETLLRLDSPVIEVLAKAMEPTCSEKRKFTLTLYLLSSMLIGSRLLRVVARMTSSAVSAMKLQLPEDKNSLVQELFSYKYFS